MGEREVLPVTVYTDDLNAAIVMVRGARDGSKKAKKEAVDLMQLLKKGEIKDFMKNLPRIGRAERLLATQVPGMREALQYTYRGKMLAGADPILAIAVISIYVTQQIKRMQETIKQERISYENMLQAGLDLNYTELSRLTKIQTGYATWRDQFMAAVEDEGVLNAIKEIVTDLLDAYLQSDYTDFYKTRAAAWDPVRDWLENLRMRRSTTAMNIIDPNSVELP